MLALRLATIEANVATQFGREIFAPKFDYPSRKLLTEQSMLVEYLITPANKLREAIYAEESIWSLEPDYDSFQVKWENLLKPASVAVITGKREMLLQGLSYASCHANIERFLPNHIFHVKVDQRAQKLEQKKFLHEHFIQNALLRVSALDSNKKKQDMFSPKSFSMLRMMIRETL